MRQLQKCLLVCLLALVFNMSTAAAATTYDPQSTETSNNLQSTATIADILPNLKSNVYLKLDGIPGDSLVKQYEKWINLTDVQFELGAITGSGGGGSVGKPVLKNFIVTKQFDSSSIPLFLQTISGKHIKTGQLVFVTKGKEQVKILTIDLGSIIISNYNFSNANEVITLKFDTIRMTYYPTDSSGKSLPPITGGWDLSKNVAIK